MTSPPSHPSSTVWPRAFLLSLYNAALTNGMVYATPVREADAHSLRQSLYRLRRRSDTSNKSFITPEMHLVTVGNWEAGPDGHGRLPILYTSMGDGVDMPGIVAATGEELAQAAEQQFTPHSPIADPIPPLDIDTLDVRLDPEEVDDFVQRMMKDAANRSADDD
jgi:hypothetical protein